MQSPFSSKSVVGMVHLLPLPGSPRYGGTMQEVLDRAARDAEALIAGGVDGIMVENYGDVPFYPDQLPAVSVSALTLAVAHVISAVSVPVGVNALRNDALSALSIAACTGAKFIRVNVHTGAMLTDQGWLAGKAHETMRLRAALAAPVAVFADVLVKHAVAPVGLSLGDAARDAFYRGGADALIVSGVATGAATDVNDVHTVKRALPAAAVWIGSGVTKANVAALLAVADGVIVGSALEQGGHAGQPVVAAQVRELVDVAHAQRS
jgi:uncharacterized protein